MKITITTQRPNPRRGEDKWEASALVRFENGLSVSCTANSTTEKVAVNNLFSALKKEIFSGQMRKPTLKCTVCGKIANLDPWTHEEWFGHKPVVFIRGNYFEHSGDGTFQTPCPEGGKRPVAISQTGENL